jgi:hypothetical protein
MHVTFAEKSLFMGDDAADVLLEYAKVLADQGRADRVTLRAIGAEGHVVDVDMLLDSGTIIAAETTNSDANPPDNSENIADIRRRLALVTSPNNPKLDVASTGEYHWLDEF